MNAPARQYENSPQLEDSVKTFGREIFSAIGKEQPSTFNKDYWAGRIMEWSMSKPEFKVNMFRLVDVLPTLTSSAAIATHVSEYLSKPGAEISGLLEWGLNINPNSLRAKITSALVRKSVREMAAGFIAGETPKEALKPLRRLRKNRLSFTVDLLGEFSLSEKEAEVYVNRYLEALEVLGDVHGWEESAPLVTDHPGESSALCISVKLTALYSQCNALNFDRSVSVLSERLTRIVREAQKKRALLYVDAEDSGNNPIIYQTFKNVFSQPEFKDFPHPGIVIQAYAKSAEATLLDFIQFAKQRGAPIAVRLVKGAYWDHETILSAQNNWPSPLFAKKESTDANYEKLSRILIDNHEHCLPAFGSHNVRSLCYACRYAESRGLSTKHFELQMLYGMAEPIARAFSSKGYLVRLYVPLGEMLPGMGYLVRRLLENTSNESFLRHTFFDSHDVDRLLAAPKFLE
ncbi:MAG: proline dehydrogenase family protein [Deltaproteobacteria bacterium]|nr:proline dehydrogenase family protein [Deltaproteobacteria bacterium]